MLDVVALRFLRLPKSVDGLLGTDPPQHHGANIIAGLALHRLHVQVKLDWPERDDCFVRQVVASWCFAPRIRSMLSCDL